MNYLTNYYKNLSETLKQKVNILESYLHQLNEDLSSGTLAPSSGASSTSSTNQNQSLDALLNAWGPVDPNSGNSVYDLNGDGFVDGDDLGNFLAQMSRGQGGPVAMGSRAAPNTLGVAGVESLGRTKGRPSVRTTADTANISSNYGSGMQPGGPGNGDDSEVQALLQNWGSNNPAFDYNGDGIVDGDDLGIALSRMISSSGNRPIAMASQNNSGQNSGNQSNRSITAIDQPGVSDNFNQGNFGAGGSPRPPAPRPPVSRGRPPAVNTGSDVYTNYGNPLTPGGSPRPPAPRPPVSGGRPPAVNTGSDVYTNYGYGDAFTPGGSPRPPAPRPPVSGGRPPAANTGFDIGAESEGGPNFGSGYNVNQPGKKPTPEYNQNQESLPYWMSGRSTDVDSSFRGMQRRRKR